jgi:hypothetical protein
VGLPFSQSMMQIPPFNQRNIDADDRQRLERRSKGTLPD